MIDAYIAQAARIFHIDRAELLNHCRRREVVLARQALAYALYQRTELGQAQIGQLLDGRDHTTIGYAIRRAEQRAVSDVAYALALCELMEAHHA